MSLGARAVHKVHKVLLADRHVPLSLLEQENEAALESFLCRERQARFLEYSQKLIECQFVHF